MNPRADCKLWLNVPGPNGLTVGGGEMFIASIPPDYKTVTSDNVIYRVKNLKISDDG